MDPIWDKLWPLEKRRYLSILHSLQFLNTYILLILIFILHHLILNIQYLPLLYSIIDKTYFDYCVIIVWKCLKNLIFCLYWVYNFFRLFTLLITLYNLQQIFLITSSSSCNLLSPPLSPNMYIPEHLTMQCSRWPLQEPTLPVTISIQTFLLLLLQGWALRGRVR